MRRLFSRAAVILLISMMCFSVLSSMNVFKISLVRGYDTEFQASYSTEPPVIDGVLGAEWNDANGYYLDLTAIAWQPGPYDPASIPATVYFKHDGTNIYLGLRVYGDSSGVEFEVYFDEGNDYAHGSGTRDSVLTAGQEDLKALVLDFGGLQWRLDDGYYFGAQNWVRYPGYYIDII